MKKQKMLTWLILEDNDVLDELCVNRAHFYLKISFPRVDLFKGGN